jgi:hypothetical protein
MTNLPEYTDQESEAIREAMPRIRATTISSSLCPNAGAKESNCRAMM